MDGSTIDYSDSDSGESWTLLEPSPALGKDTPELRNNNSAFTHERDTAETNIEKDEDTDGISIISDSDPESAPCEVTCDRCLSEENRPTEQHNPPYISVNPFPSNNNDNKSLRSEDDFLGDNSGKHKTYVHRRNKRLSTVLNIIMLGSVITAAGVAIGHMWGARNECPMQTTPSVNKILSNLYKLQEENAYLRSKLKEMTLAGHAQRLTQQRKLGSEKSTLKQPRCKKVYEEPLNNKNAERVMKCVDNENNKSEKASETPIILLQNDKDFLNDIDKLKGIYQQNKSWLDDEIAKRIKYEEGLVKKVKDKDITKSANTMRITEEPNKLKNENLKRQTESETIAKTFEPDKLPTEKKISYADSLKNDQPQNKRFKKAVNDDADKRNKEILNRKQNKDNDILYQNSFSEDDFKKDDRYNAPKSKHDRKKRDRQKLHKKLKRKNKYEQWEMNGGYKKDFDDLSLSSAQENEYTLPDKNPLSRDFERNNYIQQFMENDKNFASIDIYAVDDKGKPDKFSMKIEEENGKNKKGAMNWYEKRAAVRADARKKLEHELFGETTPNNAGWYFRRMQKRQQCRAQRDNSTFRKLSKIRMNFKMKH